MSSESSLWMGDIEPYMTKETILSFFKNSGFNPSGVKLLKDYKLRANRNYCFINFETMIEANEALINLNGKNIPKTNLKFKLNWANKHCEMNRNLYVGNLPSDIDDIQLFNIFKKKYKSVHHFSIMTEQGKSKGYGFIQFTEKEDYDLCLKEMDGFIINGKAIKVRERIKKNMKEKNNNVKNNYNNINKYNKLSINMGTSLQNSYDSFPIFKNNRMITDNNSYNYFNNGNYEEEEDQSDQDLSSSNSSTAYGNKSDRKFSDNLDIILNDNKNVLNQKIQESVDKMFKHYKNNSRNNEGKLYP
jgi:nucleolysin TIA-1/TIAR